MSTTEDVNSEDVRELAKALYVADRPQGDDSATGEANAGWEAAKQEKVVMARRVLRILKSRGVSFKIEK
ncbi:MAG: hypothetical protein ABJP33_02275 [Pseudoruegeria sp.]